MPDMPEVDIWPKEATEINRVCGKNMNEHMLDNQDPPKIEHETDATGGPRFLELSFAKRFEFPWQPPGSTGVR
jgi:hypothetical protein